MTVILILLGVIILCLLAYLLLMRRELRRMKERLQKRQLEGSHQFININLINKDLEQLASEINKCLQAEETLCLKAVREEQEFKDLIANISHDLRTPLTAVKGYLQLLNRTPLTNNQQEKLEIASKHVDELGVLIEHFFEYSYYLTAPLKVEMKEFNLTNLVLDCLASSVPMFEEKKLSLTLLKEDQAIVAADKELTIRIIQNLIRNCLMHAEAEIKVAILSMDTSSQVHFINQVSPENAPDCNRIFERFYSSNKARSSSTGLGLAIVKVLTEKMGGSVGAILEENMLDIWFEL
ncbi:MAG: HAMP domain-containing sensor histidine kinase [bacterium]|nr:HAMP domain-containing sensor histidine kinase [bacterium]